MRREMLTQSPTCVHVLRMLDDLFLGILNCGSSLLQFSQFFTIGTKRKDYTAHRSDMHGHQSQKGQSVRLCSQPYWDLLAKMEPCTQYVIPRAEK